MRKVGREDELAADGGPTDPPRRPGDGRGEILQLSTVPGIPDPSVTDPGYLTGILHVVTGPDSNEVF